MPGEADILFEDPSAWIGEYDPRLLRDAARDRIDRFAMLLRERQRRQAQRQFFNLFPEETTEIDGATIHSRLLYPRHMEFFLAGAAYRERCFMAANRVGKCRTYNDLIQHPDGATSRIGDLFERAEPFDVLAWNGNGTVAAAASHVVRKPAEQIVEVLLENGSTFKASLGHRVLTGAGYASLSTLLACVPCLPPSSSVRGQSTHGADDRRLSQIAGGSKDHCSIDRRRDDEQPPSDQECVRPLRPSPSDAQPHNRIHQPSDDLAHKHTDILSQSERHLSSLYGRLRSVARSAAFLARDAYRYARRNTGSPRAQSPLRAASSALFRSFLAILPGQGLERVRALVASDGSSTRFVAYRDAGVEPLFDLTVPRFHNYVADGIVHHNTVAGAYECTCHLTGLYPAWWEGRRFAQPIRCWAAGKTDETTRDIVQNALFGDVTFEGGRKTLSGKGMLPGYTLGRPNWKRGTDDLIDTILIKHVSGGWSRLGLKSYKQGRGAFEGTSQHVIWLDEECPLDVYGECLLRTTTVSGLVMLTFTPLEGLTETVMQFMLGMGNQLAHLSGGHRQ